MPTSQPTKSELDALVEITGILTGMQPFLEKCESTLAVLAEFAGSELVTLRELDTENSTMELIASYNKLEPLRPVTRSLPADLYLSSEAIETGNPVVVNDYSHVEAPNRIYMTGVSSALSIPIQIDGEMFGTLGFASSTTGYYQEDTVRVILALASVVGMMVAKAQLQEINEVEANIGRIVGSPLIGPDVFARFAEECSKVIQFDRLTLNSVDIAENTFVTEFLLGDSLPDVPLGITRKIDGTILEEAVRCRVSQRIRLDDRADLQAKYPNANPYFFDGQSGLINIPLIVSDQVIGTIGIIRSVRWFTKNDLNKAERLGNLVAGAFADFKQQEYRTRTDQEISKNRAILEAEANIGQILISPLNRVGAFERLRNEITNIIPAERVGISAIDLETERFGSDFLELLGDTESMTFKNQGQKYAGSITAEVVKYGTTQVLESDDPRLLSGTLPRAQMVFDRGYRTMMAVPLMLESRIIGTLILCSIRERVFGSEDIANATRFGNLLAGALATLIMTAERNKAQLAVIESEIANRAILEVEAAVGRILSSPTDVSNNFDSLREVVSKVITLDRILISSINLEDETWSVDFNEFLNQPELGLMYSLEKSYLGSLTGEVVSTGESQILHFDDPRLTAGQFSTAQRAFDRGNRSMMLLPLKFEGSIIGILGFFSIDSLYTPDDLAIADRIGRLLSGALVTYKITSERDTAQQALSESDQRFRQIADSIGGVFWLTELNPLKLVYASSNFERVWDIPIESVYEDFNQWSETIHHEDEELVRFAARQVSETAEFQAEYRIVKRDGSVRWIRSRGFPIKDENGVPYRMSGIAEDITDQKTELGRITEAGRLLAIGELASGVAHEINNPLAIINLNAEEALGDTRSIAVLENLRVILNQVNRAATIVRNLLRFARESTQQSEAISPTEVINRCLLLKRHDFLLNNIVVSTDFEMESQEFVVDESLMTQVVLNILSNAEQACVSSHGRGHISIGVQDMDGMIRISISDDGGGIPAENLAKVFDPFFTTKSVDQGTGLGLSVSYGITIQLGGNLWAESDGVSGSTFYIEVPPIVSDSEPELVAVDDAEDGQSALPLRVLVVDDEQDLRNIMGRLVERNGHVVETASTGEEAWEKLQDSEFDCIFLDLRMAGVDGIELYGRVVSSNPDQADKIIIVTGDLANERTRAFLKPLSNQVLEKPISVDDIERVLERVEQGI
ncbi:MAG: GAF domain-containing protein [Chloroflexi bacterium]|nr:GAF domain-containing protein [Chloroflexota bacterium]